MNAKTLGKLGDGHMRQAFWIEEKVLREQHRTTNSMFPSSRRMNTSYGFKQAWKPRICAQHKHALRAFYVPPANDPRERMSLPHSSALDFSASRLYVTGCKVNMELLAPNITNPDMEASGFHDTVEFRIYNKLSQASRGFPKKVGLSVTRSVGLVFRQVVGPFGKEAYVPEYQYVPEEDDGPLPEAALRPLPTELQPVAMDDHLPQGDSDFAIQEFDSDYDSYDSFNSSIEDFDPAQDDTDYNPSSDETLEPLNALGLGESSVLRTALLSGHQQPNKMGLTPVAAAEGTIQYFDLVDSSESRPNPSTGEELSIQEAELAHGLIIYSLTTPASASQDSKAAFLAMTARYAFLTGVDEYQGFTAYKHRDSESRWLVVQEFSETDDFDLAWMALKKKQAKQWWWKNGWENTSLAFYCLEDT